MGRIANFRHSQPGLSLRAWPLLVDRSEGQHPPSALPGISPARGEIGSVADGACCGRPIRRRERRQPEFATLLHLAPSLTLPAICGDDIVMNLGAMS
ncbi:MAG: hypothetical protein E5X89_32530 [Mesorhizobium sp.]|nr:MAG: hypothetical protein E5X89_32530 [Mesorhizobium sp.]TIP07998.1 MAG: hypothetical protein E5X73_34370 [Mesorhizobium sp.]